MKKRLWCLLMGLLPFGLNADEMKVPFDVAVDFSKKGTVYETDFQAPWNIWGSWVEFRFGVGSKPSVSRFTPNGQQYYTHTDEENRIDNYIRTGIYRDADGKLIPTKETPYFKLKVTLTPLGSGASWFPEMTKKEFKDGEKVEFIVSVPLYGWGNVKTIMIADLQRLRNYHIKIESLENVKLPKDVKTTFCISRYSRKV